VPYETIFTALLNKFIHNNSSALVMRRALGMAASRHYDTYESSIIPRGYHLVDR
jgi:hypothetical protein